MRICEYARCPIKFPSAWVSGAKHSSIIHFSCSPGLSRECCRPYRSNLSRCPMPDARCPMPDAL
ncbi:MAG: hypothetical protein F6J93_13210 [Oscillatoria sp. SIO1A7]|nr:hypothetical protein [Oscillatoria sp. SIO1A7]